MSIGLYPDAYTSIFTPLGNGASVYLRGCNVGAGEEGLKLLKIWSSCKALRRHGHRGVWMDR